MIGAFNYKHAFISIWLLNCPKLIRNLFNFDFFVTLGMSPERTFDQFPKDPHIMIHLGVRCVNGMMELETSLVNPSIIWRKETQNSTNIGSFRKIRDPFEK